MRRDPTERGYSYAQWWRRSVGMAFVHALVVELVGGWLIVAVPVVGLVGCSAQLGVELVGGCFCL